jgi:hypothetical protein
VPATEQTERTTQSFSLMRNAFIYSTTIQRDVAPGPIVRPDAGQSGPRMELWVDSQQRRRAP